MVRANDGLDDACVLLPLRDRMRSATVPVLTKVGLLFPARLFPRKISPVPSYVAALGLRTVFCDEVEDAEYLRGGIASERSILVNGMIITGT